MAGIGRIHPVLWSGLLAGLLDACYATAVFTSPAVAPVRVWQSVASGLLGRAAFQGGWATGALGLLLHLLIALAMAAIYWLASRRSGWMRRHPWRSGLLYGLCLYLVMTFVVLPLSAVPFAHPVTARSIALNLPVHLVFGLIFAFAGRRPAP